MELQKKGSGNIANYLMKYKGTYRLKTEYDARLKTFPREYNGQFADNDIYIDCNNKTRIYSFGYGVLQVYIPSLQRGHNFIKAIKEQFQEEIIFDIEESSCEVLFKFHAKHLEKLVPIFKPKTSGASISPFSSKNLPHNKSYKIPEDELEAYKEFTSKLEQNELIKLVHCTKNFLQLLTNKKNTWEDIKADMAIKGLKNKEYIHSIGKWNDYIKYLENNL